MNSFIKRVLNGLLTRSARLFPDKLYLQLKYRIIMGKKLDLNNPRTFNEKLQWLKLYNRNPEYTKMVDKYAVKEYVAKKIGKEYVIPTIGVWNSPEEIDFDTLPNQFVLKTTHGGGSGGVVICRDKSNFNATTAIAKLRASMNSDIYVNYREWPYKDVPKKIIAEQLLENNQDGDLKDYKLFCFNGIFKFCKVDYDRFTDHHANYYSPSWSLLDFGEADLPPKPEIIITKPENFVKMIVLAEKLAKDIPFARIDFYEVNGRIYFGEITFYPASGFGPWTPADADSTIGKYLELPPK